MAIGFDDVCKYIPFPYGSAAKLAWKVVPTEHQNTFITKINQAVALGNDSEQREKLINEGVDNLTIKCTILAPHKERIKDALNKMVIKITKMQA
jgi:hypothetical protein